MSREISLRSWIISRYFSIMHILDTWNIYLYTFIYIYIHISVHDVETQIEIGQFKHWPWLYGRHTQCIYVHTTYMHTFQSIQSGLGIRYQISTVQYRDYSTVHYSIVQCTSSASGSTREYMGDMCCSNKISCFMEKLQEHPPAYGKE